MQFTAMRTLLVVITLTIIALITFAFVKEGALVLFSQESETGTLTVVTPNSSVSLRIDGESYTTTPATGISLPTGEHLVSIGDEWQTKIQIAGNTQSTIDQTLFSNSIVNFGYQVGFEQLQTLFAQSSLTIVTTPSDAVITVNGKTQQSSPAIIPVRESESFEIVVSKDGFKDRVLSLSVPKSTRAQVVVSLIPNVYESLTVRAVDDVTTSETGVPQSISRVEWGGAMLPANEVPLTTWQNVVAYQLVPFTNSSDIETLLVLDEISRFWYGYDGIPFAYVITADATLYEGIGVYNYDFSTISGRGFQAGDVPVLIISSEITQDISTRLRDVVTLSETAPAPSVRNISEVSQITLALGEGKQIAMRFQNTGSTVWQNPQRFVVRAIGNEGISELYDPVKWKSISDAISIDSSFVYPGADFSFMLPIQAPYYPVQVTQNFVIFDTETSSEVLGSQFVLSISVTGEDVGTLTILDTPTGYLNVRGGPSIGSALVTTVFPGEKFAYKREDGEWIQIILRDGVFGWINTKYVQKLQ